MDKRDLDLQIEVVQVSIYYDLIRRILVKFRSISIIKVSVICFIIKKREYLQGNIYSAKHTNDVILKYLSQVSGLFDELCGQFKYILEAIDILVADGDCIVHEGELTCKHTIPVALTGFDDFTDSAIQHSLYYTDRQFLKEVISVV